MCTDLTAGVKVLNTNRRFVLGRNLKDLPSLHKFSSAQLGLEGDMEVQIPKSMNRLRVRGSGSRFVHGGAALQEIVIPLLKVNKKRQSRHIGSLRLRYSVDQTQSLLQVNSVLVYIRILQ